MVLNKRENKENKYIRINREQYKTNFKNITDYLQKKPAVALKHNGYGLGILEIAKALDEVFCETYFVNFLEEAILLKENLKNVKNIITLEFTNKEDLFLYEKENIIFSISSAEELNLLDIIQDAKTIYITQSNKIKQDKYSFPNLHKYHF
jgi:alanine racemase